MTERPGFGLQVAPEQQSNSNSRRVVPSNNDNLPLETLFDDENSVDEIEGPSGPSGPSGTGIGNIIPHKTISECFCAERKCLQKLFKISFLHIIA